AIQREIAAEAYRHQQRVESGEQVVVGVNRFASKEERQLELYQSDPGIAARQRAELARVRESRDSRRVTNALAALREAAAGRTNLMPLIVEAVLAYASVGEICAVLRERFGTFQE